MRYKLAALNTDPAGMRMLCVTAICAVALAITHSFVPIAVFYGYGAIYSIVASRWVKGKVPILSRRVAENFYIVPSLRGWHSIHQLRANKTIACKEIRRSLVHTGDLNAVLPNGRYRVLSHETVLRRVRRTPGVCILKEMPMGKQDMKKTLNYMTHNRCKTCPEKCNAWRSEPREYYDVMFEITEGL